MEGQYGDWKDWLLCLAIVIALQARFPSMGKRKHKNKHPLEIPKPTAMAPESKPKLLERSESITIIIGVAGIAMVVFPSQSLVLRILAAIATAWSPMYLSHKSHWVSDWGEVRKTVTALVVTTTWCLVAAYCIGRQWIKEHPSDVLMMQSNATHLKYKIPFAGCTWRDDLADIRLIISGRAYDEIEGFDATIEVPKGSRIINVCQIETSAKHCDFRPLGNRVGTLKMRGTNGTIGLLDASDYGPSPATLRYRVHCEYLYPSDEVRLAIATLDTFDVHPPKNLTVSTSYTLVTNDGNHFVKSTRTLVVSDP